MDEVVLPGVVKVLVSVMVRVTRLCRWRCMLVIVVVTIMVRTVKRWLDGVFKSECY